jgi:hypothetical protein
MLMLLVVWTGADRLLLLAEQVMFVFTSPLHKSQQHYMDAPCLIYPSFDDWFLGRFEIRNNMYCPLTEHPGY